MQFDAIVFDFGGVLFDWNPEYVYRELIPDTAEREFFLGEVCNLAWNHLQDAGRTLDEATESKVAEFPQYEALIRAYYARWPQMLKGEIPEGVALLQELAALDIPLYGLTNWQQETFPYAEQHFPHVLKHFRQIVVSGRIKLAKPDPAIFHYLTQAIGHAPSRCVFIDDNAANIATASALGFLSIHHQHASTTRQQLIALGVGL